MCYNKFVLNNRNQAIIAINDRTDQTLMNKLKGEYLCFANTVEKKIQTMLNFAIPVDEI